MAWLHELNHEKAEPQKPATPPALRLPAVDAAAEAKEIAERAAITRTIRQGRDCWERIGDSNSFSAWCKIGAALHIGKTQVLLTSGANCAWGSTYSRAFNRWMSEHGFAAMRPSDRSHAVALHENLPAIEQWRATLPDKQRRRLRGAQQNVKRWRRETGAANAARRDDVERALAAWRHFPPACRRSPGASPERYGPSSRPRRRPMREATLEMRGTVVGTNRGAARVELANGSVIRGIIAGKLMN